MPSARRSRPSAAVVDQDRVRDDRRRRVAVGGVDPDVHAVRDEAPQGRLERRLGQGVRVAPDEQRAVGALAVAVPADRLGRRRDVRLVEGAVERRAAVAGRPERDPLGGVGRVRPDVVVGPHEPVEVDERRRLGRSSGSLADRHRISFRTIVQPATVGFAAVPADGLQGSGRPRCCTGRTAGIGHRRRSKVTPMDHDDDLALSSRLAALEARAPATGGPPGSAGTGPSTQAVRGLDGDGAGVRPGGRGDRGGRRLRRRPARRRGLPGHRESRVGRWPARRWNA